LPVAEKYYTGQRGLVLLMIDPSLLSSDSKWELPSRETSPPGVPEGESFPHIYSPINLDAVVKVFDLEAAVDGQYKSPTFE
jgi:uncharacterized protein (DUF952 family)